MRENFFVICAAFLLIGGSFLMQQPNRGAVAPKNTYRTPSYGCPLFPGLILPRDFDVKAGGNQPGNMTNGFRSAGQPHDASL